MADRFGWSIVAGTVGGMFLVGVAGGRPVVPLAWLLFVGSSVHVTATLALFSFAEVRSYARVRRRRFVVVPAVLLAVAVAACLMVPPGVVSAALFGFFAWQLWHYQKQNLGLASLAVASARLPSLTRGERRCILTSGAGGVFALAAHPGVLQLVRWRLPGQVVAAMFVLAVVVLAATVVAAVGFAVRRWRSAATRPAATVVYLLAAAFPLPLVVTSAPYVAIGGLTLAHGLQYLLLVGQVNIGPPGTRCQATWVRLVALATLVVAAGGVLAVASHLHGDGHVEARAAFGAYLAVVMTHFVVDAGLWRLREQFPRRWLTQRAPHLLGVPSGGAS